MFRLVAFINPPVAQRDFILNYLNLTGKLTKSQVIYFDDNGDIGIMKESQSRDELEQLASYIDLFARHARLSVQGSIKEVPNPVL